MPSAAFAANYINEGGIPAKCRSRHETYNMPMPPVVQLNDAAALIMRSDRTFIAPPHWSDGSAPAEGSAIFSLRAVRASA